MAAVAAALALPLGSSSSPAPPTPWNGANPYRCRIQDAGFGTKVRHPHADPYCVRFNKTRQNVTQLGLLDFLSKEPARTAAAVPKCFYFQVDHWRGSVVQSDGRTVLWEWVGHYFFNKATGDGGAWIKDFRLGGHTVGTGGAITHDSIPVDQRCATYAREHPRRVYRTPNHPET